MSRLGKLFIIAAPSGCGKTSLIKALLAETSDLKMSVSCTTRPQRKGEVDGQDYHFVSRDVFQAMLAENDFLEYATVFGHLYGTPRTWVDKVLAKGVDVILEIDWQGAKQVRMLKPNVVDIFIFPPSREVLTERLLSRAQDDEASLKKRLSESVLEMSHYDEYQYLIINDDFKRAIADLQSIILSYRLEVASQQAEHAALIAGLLG